ncbi:MAG: halo transducer protein, partial [Haloferacaceae archaeon]
PETLRHRPTAVYDLAVRIQEAKTTGRAAIQAADELSSDIERFQSWLEQPERRYDALEEDADLVGDSVDELESAVDALGEGAADPAVQWATATMRTGVLSLLVADLRAEHRDLRVLAERNDEPFRNELGDRFDDLDGRLAEIESALDDAAEPAWRDRFEGDLSTFDRELASFDPPVEWGAVERVLETHRPDASTESQ